MKRITMRDFTWLIPPRAWKKNYRSLEFTLDPSGNDALANILLAVSDEDFHLQADLDLAPVNMTSGLCVYHTDETYAKLGANQEEITTVTSIGGYRTFNTFEQSCSESALTWHIERKGPVIQLGYAKGEETAPMWVSKLLLPAMEKAVSFGFYFTNNDKCTYTVHLHNVRYTKTG